MEFRKVVTAFGHTFEVPQWIQRLDNKATHGWQLRYGQFTMFTDHTNDGSGSRKALKLARAELKKRVQTLPAPNKIRHNIAARKSNDLPVGISGPVERIRAGKSAVQYYFAVSIPRFGQRPTNKSIYIATENTYSDAKEARALAKARKVRGVAVTEYERQHQLDRIKQAKQL
jgi:hypothetical protein